MQRYSVEQEQLFRSAFLQATNIVYSVPIIQVWKQLGDTIWHVEFTFESFLCHALIIGDAYGYRLYFDVSTTRILLINPALEEFKQAAKDIARIGHS